MLIFLELDIATGRVLYEWSSLDHVDPSGDVPTSFIGKAIHSLNQRAIFR